MPRHPDPSGAMGSIPGGFVFTPLAGKVRNLGGAVFPLHVGDTWKEPFEGGRMEDLVAGEGLHRYSDPPGRRDLIDAIVEKVRRDNRIPCDPSSVLVTSGATGALAAALGMLLDPGEEVLILAPFWPLIPGMVRTFRARPVEVPFYDRAGSAAQAVLAISRRITDRTVALYVSTPSNPTGRVLAAEWLEAIAGLAARHGLWILSDEVYEHYAYRGEHVSIARFAPERTLTAFSFSKSYGMAGNRTGYLVGPPQAIREALKVSTHTVYAASTAGQEAGRRAILHGGAWLSETKRDYRAAGEAAARTLGLAPPEGSTFLFFDVAPHLDERGIRGFLEDCLDDGIVLAPGLSCGADYASWVRLCYTCLAPEKTVEGVARLARRLGRNP